VGCYGGDGGLAIRAGLSLPAGVAVDGNGNLYIADTYNHRIRKVNGATGVITTIAGNGCLGLLAGPNSPGCYSGDGGPATSASLSFPAGVAVDGSGNVFIADTGNNRIRKVDAGTEIITTVAGNSCTTFEPSTSSTYLFAGCYGGDGGPATNASLNLPQGVTVYGSGTLYIADTE